MPTLLDGQPKGMILDPIQKPAIGPVCCCPKPQKGRLGGCRPALRWASHDRLEACCAVCLKPLRRGLHRGRLQLWALGLVALFERDPSCVDLEDLQAHGDIVGGPRPEPPEVLTAGRGKRRAPRLGGAALSDAELADLRQLAEDDGLDALLKEAESLAELLTDDSLEDLHRLVDQPMPVVLGPEF